MRAWLSKEFKFVIAFAIIIIIAIVSSINLAGLYLLTPSSLSKSETVIIEQKLSLKQIAVRLKSRDIIAHPRFFWLIARFYALKYPLKSGEYIFTPKISPLQVLNILATGKSIIHKLVIPEGSMVSEIIAKVNCEELLLGEIKGEVPEGFLMPSTYFFAYGDQKEQIIAQMRKGMSLALDKIMLKLAPASPLKSRIEVLTLASIVEKETSLDEERAMIAAVFLNRLKKNMRLQADPTVIYAITGGKFKLGRLLSKADLLINSLYNTYYVPALPPAPIACPGIKSLEAVVSPAKTNALYFVVNGKGGHNFSTNLIDHNNNVKLYRANQNSLKKEAIP